ncbi:hypothetical protein MBLNU459_g5621t2 [Dothideomycetes sp. NU459]
MEAKHGSKVISVEDFEVLLALYKTEVPAKLDDLEAERLHEIPTRLSKRKASDAHLTKPELQTLMEWKLPSLRKLVASNSDEAVAETSRSAFALYAEDGEAWEAAISMLAKGLRGVGPATASLLLNVYDGARVPFFSDELFRWVMYEEGRGKGWDRPIKYTAGEYRQLFSAVESVRGRLNGQQEGREVTALEVEMVAYVLGRKKAGQEALANGKRAEGKGGAGRADGADRMEQEEEEEPKTRRASKRRKLA